MNFDKEHAHQLLDQLAPGQFAAVLQLLEAMVDSAAGEGPLSGEDRRAVAASREWYAKNPEGIPFEQIVAECGLTMEDIKSSKGD